MTDEATEPDADGEDGDHDVPPDLLDLHVAIEADEAGMFNEDTA